uniref:DUF4220 domain-containing protein n=1 Tax=Fagus sylvatica TaxID=28930 RepID=A0A2N9F1D1_FAGSY
MIDPIPVFLKKVWDKWNIKVIVLVSLFLQTVLILAAPLRKRTSKKLVSLLIWSSYLLADWAANFAIGHISNGQRNSGPCCDMDDNNNLGGGFISSVKFKLFQSSSKRDNDADLVAFWAPFLLLHLGGPDTITAFSLEDNELWLRHLFAFIVQLLATLYVLVLTLPKNNLLVPTILMFVAGIIKYLERTRALFRASLDSFRESMLKDPDPGPNYAKLMEEYSSKIEAGLPTTIEMTPEPGKESKLAATVNRDKLSDFEVVQYAYRYFEKFKGLIVELIFSFRERNESRDFFQCRTAEEALKIIELELNFIYEALYTKVVVVHNRVGYIFRFLSTASVVVAFGLFHFLDKRGLKEIDIVVTYALLGGAICLDAIALFMLIFSDWTFGAIDININNRMGKCVEWIGTKYLRSKTSSWSDDDEEYLSTPKLLRRWSESVSTFNLIDYCLKQRTYEFKYNPFMFCLDKLVDYLGGRDFVKELKYVKREKFRKKLWVLIFDELLEKSREADDAETTKRICSARGAYVCQEGEWGNDQSRILKPVHVKGDRSKSVLFDACMLAKELNKLENDQKWKLISKVWVEMLSYAASHCRPATHAQQVSKGGQLISFVWLLMAHFGLGEQFQINEGHARAKLVVGK